VKSNVKIIEVRILWFWFNVQDLIHQGTIELREFKKEIYLLRQEIESMERALFTHNEENKKVLFPSIDSNMDELLSAINMQKHQNAMLQKQLTDLQKEKQQMQQQILAFHSRIELLEEQVGVQ